MSLRDPKTLRSAINRLMHKRGYGRPGGDEALADAWHDALEAIGQAAEGTRVLKLSRRTLHIGVADVSRRSELEGYFKATLLDAIQQRHAELDVQNLKFELLRASGEPDEPWFDE